MKHVAHDRLADARGSQRGRAFVLVTIIIVALSLLLIATALAWNATSARTLAHGTGVEASTRALAASGVLAIMAELDEQRDRMLEGGMPRIEDEYVIYEPSPNAGGGAVGADLGEGAIGGVRRPVGALGVVRLLGIGPDGSTLVPENAKADLNRLTADEIERCGLVDAAMAKAIVTAREARPGQRFGSIEDLLEVEGISAERLWGETIELIARWDARSTSIDSPGTAAPDEALMSTDATEAAASIPPQEVSSAVRGLADVFTVYAVEPAVQRSDEPRIVVQAEWTDDFARVINDRFGEGAADALRPIIEAEGGLKDDAAIYRVMNKLKSPPEEWPAVVDLFTAERSRSHRGRLDINRAPYEALLTLPELSEDQASRLVEARRGISAEESATVAWPAMEQIIAPEKYPGLADRLTARSWVYRFGLAAGELDANGQWTSRPIVLEVVVDMSVSPGRVLFVHDMTMLRAAHEGRSIGAQSP